MLKKSLNLPKNWNVLKLSEVLWFQEGPGVRNNQFTSKGVKLFNVSNIVEGKINLSKTKIYISEEEAYSKYKHFLVDKDDLVIASSGIKVENFENKVAFVNENHLPLCMNTSTIRFKALDENKIDIKYFSCFLKSVYFKRQVQLYITGSAQLNFGPSHLNKMELILPPLETQKKIAKVLDKADELRQKRKQANAKLDEFLQSVFLDMFGDPVRNPKGWNVKKLESLSNKITDGVHSKPKYTETGVPFISVKDITTKKLIFNDCKFISKVEHETYCKRCKPEYLDILYTKVGATYGRAAIVDTNNEFSLYVSVALIKPKKELIDPFFLKAVMNSVGVKNQADKSIKGIGVPDLHLIEIKNFLIPVPPMELQQKFLSIVEKVEEQKTKNEASAQKLDDLFNSLLQRAFKGKLEFSNKMQ